MPNAEDAMRALRLQVELLKLTELQPRCQRKRASRSGLANSSRPVDASLLQPRRIYKTAYPPRLKAHSILDTATLELLCGNPCSHRYFPPVRCPRSRVALGQQLHLLGITQHLGGFRGYKPSREEVSHHHAGSEKGMDDRQRRQRNRVFLAFQECLDNAVRRMAALHASRNLRNHGGGQIQPLVMFAIFGQRLGQLLGSSDSQVRAETPARGSGIIEVDYLAREVGAIAGEQIEVRPVIF